MNAEQFLNILKCNLTSSAKKFGFNKNNGPDFKFYHDNDLKHKALNVRNWLVYNCGKVIDIENFWVHLKKNDAKRSPNNRAALKAAILEEWHKIPQQHTRSCVCQKGRVGNRVDLTYYLNYYLNVTEML